MIVRLSADKPASLFFTSSFKSPLKHKIRRWKNKLVITANGEAHEGVLGAISEETQIEIKNEAGHVKVDNQSLSVQGANTVTLYISSATNFISYDNVSGNAHQKASVYLNDALKVPYEQARMRHIAAYQEQFNRVKLELGTSEIWLDGNVPFQLT